jgi:hypothetical protein
MIIDETLRPTIARGNCNSMNSDIAGKIMSLVSGPGNILAAVAKELNATSTTENSS